ncbi:MAG: hypothetical protein KAV97_04470 [Actinomycetia bacterium]|nr:hypothetical protein [Actinomycetes bacterium]
MPLNCPKADSRLSPISMAKISGTGKFSKSSRLSLLFSSYIRILCYYDD